MPFFFNTQAKEKFANFTAIENPLSFTFKLLVLTMKIFIFPQKAACQSADFYHHRLFHDVDISCIESCVLTVN